ncbi:hypothetical protein B0T13DRAFT_93332 [Neurospora crassa]|nr:hypothetical protein B0T13DRAFT_93332 [Neurospora crassa]
MYDPRRALITVLRIILISVFRLISSTYLSMTARHTSVCMYVCMYVCMPVRMLRTPARSISSPPSFPSLFWLIGAQHRLLVQNSTLLSRTAFMYPRRKSSVLTSTLGVRHTFFASLSILSWPVNQQTATSRDCQSGAPTQPAASQFCVIRATRHGRRHSGTNKNSRRTPLSRWPLRFVHLKPRFHPISIVPILREGHFPVSTPDDIRSTPRSLFRWIWFVCYEVPVSLAELGKLLPSSHQDLPKIFFPPRLARSLLEVF